MIAKIRYIAKNTGIAKIEIFAMHSNFRYHSEMSSISNFGTVPGYCSIASCGYYSHCIIPFLLAFKFFIPGLLKLIENHMKLMEINPTLL